LSGWFYAVLAGFVVTYLACVEVAKYWFYTMAPTTTTRPLRRTPAHRVQRIAARWSHHRPLAT